MLILYLYPLLVLDGVVGVAQWSGVIVEVSMILLSPRFGPAGA